MPDAFVSDSYPPISPRILNVGGLRVDVWGLDALTIAPAAGSAPPDIAVMFLLHGRQSSVASIANLVRYILTETWKHRDAHGAGRAKELLVVTFDVRNHGDRVIGPLGNEGWKKNVNHALDMYAIQTGTAQDVSFLVTFLPAFLFPDNTSAVATWICAGISLGGHSVWLAGVQDPRLTHLIPIIGAPDYHALFTDRAARVTAALAKRAPPATTPKSTPAPTLTPPAPTLPLSSPHFPPALAALVRASDPVHKPLSTWAERRILVVAGARDTAVPHVAGGSAAFARRLQEEGGDVEVLVDADAAHEVTRTMGARVVHWVWAKALVGDRDGTDARADSASSML